MEQFVLPAPVGAQISRFSAVKRAVSQTRLWMRFRLVMPLQEKRGSVLRSMIAIGRAVTGADGTSASVGRCGT